MSEFTVDDAIVLAATAHAGQRDKGRPELPYLTHPMRLLATFDDDPIRQMIAVLHDVVEDTDITLDDLRRRGAPPRVVDAVALLTHDKDEPRPEYLRRIRTNADALAVKLADNADNSNPERLALLDPTTAGRLRSKYEADRAILLGDD